MLVCLDRHRAAIGLARAIAPPFFCNNRLEIFSCTNTTLVINEWNSFKGQAQRRVEKIGGGGVLKRWKGVNRIKVS